MLKKKSTKLAKRIKKAFGIPVFGGPRILWPMDNGPAFPPGTTSVDVSGYITFYVANSDDVHLDGFILNPLPGQGPPGVTQPVVDSSGWNWDGGQVSGLRDGNQVVVVASLPRYPGTVEDAVYFRIATAHAGKKASKNSRRA